MLDDDDMFQMAFRSVDRQGELQRMTEFLKLHNEDRSRVCLMLDGHFALRGIHSHCWSMLALLVDASLMGIHSLQALNRFVPQQSR